MAMISGDDTLVRGGLMRLDGANPIPTEELDVERCVLCWDSMPSEDDDGEYVKLHCGHDKFHQSCLAKSWKYNPQCPLCRADMFIRFEPGTGLGQPARGTNLESLKIRMFNHIHADDIWRVEVVFVGLIALSYLGFAYISCADQFNSHGWARTCESLPLQVLEKISATERALMKFMLCSAYLMLNVAVNYSLLFIQTAPEVRGFLQIPGEDRFDVNLIYDELAEIIIRKSAYYGSLAALVNVLFSLFFRDPLNSVISAAIEKKIYNTCSNVTLLDMVGVCGEEPQMPELSLFDHLGAASDLAWLVCPIMMWVALLKLDSMYKNVMAVRSLDLPIRGRVENFFLAGEIKTSTAMVPLP